MKRILFLIPFICLCFFTAFTQTASIEKGCVPLVVAFDAPSASNYFWDFDDGSSSLLQNPDHTFTEPGQYEVVLRNGQGGATVGIISITVYADPIFEVEASIYAGCGPLTVDFNSFITIDPALTIENISWSFGDGASSTELNPTHTYTASGNYSVSLELTTNESACNKTQIFEELILVESIGNVGFSLTFDEASCDVPAEVQINNNSFILPDISNTWDFGNGTTSSEREPISVIYSEDGVYEIVLTVTTSQGCSETSSQTITIGQVPFQVEIPDTVCLGSPISILNSTPIDSFVWVFGPSASIDTSDLRTPTVAFFSPGIQTFQLHGVDEDDCSLDTSFQVFVEQPNPFFTISPTEGCIDPQVIELTADVQDHMTYIWNDSVTSNPQFEYEIVCPLVDSLYINTRDSILMQLQVISAAGCTASFLTGYVSRKPYAHLVPSVTEGCAPLNVIFVDASISLNGFENTYLDFGDGTTTTNEVFINHTYTEPGEYYAQLIVETSEGCRDTSAGRWIRVGEQITPTYTISDTDICLHDSVEITLLNDDPRIDGWHVYTDDARTGHCFTEPSMTHQFITNPGVYDVEFSINYNGCFTNLTAPEQITVNGTNADISYMFDCETPYDMMMKNDGLNANQVTWLMDSVEISTLDSLSYTFSERGEYLLTLIAEDNSGCPADTSSVEIFITDPIASFEIPERICNNVAYGFDATTSIDVDEDCSQGYLWKFPNSRPREVDTAILDHVIDIPGLHEITLIVEDMHGCRDTTTRSTTVYGIEADMIADTYNTCLPNEITFANISTVDTTLVNQQWSFGSNDSIASLFLEGTFWESLIVSLVIEDAIGCTDTVSQTLTFYNPFTEVEVSNGPLVCLNEAVVFSATDYTDQGSFLNFTWIFGGVDTLVGQEVTYVFDELGTHSVELYFEEEGTGCNGTWSTLYFILELPDANFISSLDSIDPICAPAQIELTDISTYPWTVESEWYIDGEGPYDGDMTTFAFDKGTHEVELVVTSNRGCVGTYSNSYTLVGPEGNFSIDPLEICVGEEATFTLFDAVDVSRWEWDFGDGSIASNGNPVTHTYGFLPDGGTTNVNLTLFSEDTGCESITSMPIDIVEPEAFFEELDTAQYCNGTVTLNNLSTDANEFTWSTNGQVFSNEESPSFNFGYSGTFEVTLVASILGQECFSEYTTEITLDSISGFVQLPNVFTPNNDGNNDTFRPVVTTPELEELVTVITFKVYNRWGQLVYDNENPLLGWDGNFKNKEAPTGVYAYYIEYEIVDCNNQARKGNVTIVR